MTSKPVENLRIYRPIKTPKEKPMLEMNVLMLETIVLLSMTALFGLAFLIGLTLQGLLIRTQRTVQDLESLNRYLQERSEPVE